MRRGPPLGHHIPVDVEVVQQVGVDGAVVHHAVPHAGFVVTPWGGYNEADIHPLRVGRYPPPKEVLGDSK